MTKYEPSDDARRYEVELERLREFVQTRHPIGTVKHIGLMECVTAAMELLDRRAADQSRPDDSEPITAEWWWPDGASPFRDALGGAVSIQVSCGGGALLWVLDSSASLPHIRTRGDLRRLWVALTGSELDERKAGE